MLRLLNRAREKMPMAFARPGPAMVDDELECVGKVQSRLTLERHRRHRNKRFDAGNQYAAGFGEPRQFP